MSDVTSFLEAAAQGDPAAAEQLLLLVYEELRKLAAARLAQEKPGQTLQATALVHDAYLRLVDVEKAQRWDSRGHFFAAAAESMRRILVDNGAAKRLVTIARGFDPDPVRDRMRPTWGAARLPNAGRVAAAEPAYSHRTTSGSRLPFPDGVDSVTC